MDDRLEERYYVIKIKHLDHYRRGAIWYLLNSWGVEPVDCVVIEEDWPQYRATVDSLFNGSE